MTKKYPNSCIIVFAREPRLGEVKTRLANVIGRQKSLALYEAMLHRLGTLLQRCNLAKWDLWVTSNSSHKSFISICNLKDIYIQNGVDLGQKMSNAIINTLARKEVESVLVIGTDCPALDTDYLDSALQALEMGNEVVLGPAEDGGYVLIGARRCIPELFFAIPWGTNKVLAETVQRLDAQGLPYKLLQTLWDVDRVDDLNRLKQLNPPLGWENE